MKVLFHCEVPFLLAHGGAQIQIEQTKAGLEVSGVAVEFLRWWDENQQGDILHFFGRLPTGLLRLAQGKGLKVVQSAFLGGQSARPRWRLHAQKLLMRAMARTLPPLMIAPYHWDSYRLADACVALTPGEARVLVDLFAVAPARVRVIPNGVEAVFFEGPDGPRGDWLVCTATIAPVKRVRELAAAAVQARTPVWFIGKPYAEADPYVQQFLALARQHPDLIRYDGPLTQRAQLAAAYRAARGFVLVSAWESLSLAALEAAACRCPLLLSDQSWARGAFGDAASYCPVTTRTDLTARCLRQFYERAPQRPTPPRPPSWPEVAQQLKAVYESLGSNP